MRLSRDFLYGFLCALVLMAPLTWYLSVSSRLPSLPQTASHALAGSPVAGQRWVMKENPSYDPWSRESMVGVTILDVRDGWVRFKIGPGILFPDERMLVSLFVDIYKLAESHQGGTSP